MSEGRVAMIQGRIVWSAGKLFEGQVKTIYGTQTPQLNQQGERVIEYGFGLAVPKAELADPNRGGPFWTAMHEEAWLLFPSRQIPPAFAMKFKDGDGVDDKGKPFASREGYPGCLVFSIKTQQTIRFFRWENGQNIQVNEGIKCGDYVEVQVRVKSHPAIGQGKAGLYLNPMAVRFVAAGKEIINAPSGDQIFGAGMPPPPTNFVPPEAPPVGQMIIAPPAPGGYPAPAAAAPTAPAPHYGVVPPAFQPPPGGQPIAPMMPAPPAAAHPAMPGPVHPGYGGMPPVPR